MYKLRHIFFFVLMIAFDQYTKYLARTELAAREVIPVLPGILSLHYHENDGAVWGILSGKVPFLIVFTLIILGGMVWFYSRIPHTMRYEPLRLIIVCMTAGAVGNLIDRIVYGKVTDFLCIELFRFPIFNVADCYITISAALLILLAIFYYKEEDFYFLSRRRRKTNAEEPSSDKQTEEEEQPSPNGQTEEEEEGEDTKPGIRRVPSRKKLSSDKQRQRAAWSEELNQLAQNEEKDDE